MRRRCSQGEIGMQNEKRRCSLPFATTVFFFLNEIVVFFDKFPDFVISGLCASVKLLAKVVVFAGGSKGSNTRRRF